MASRLFCTATAALRATSASLVRPTGNFNAGPRRGTRFLFQQQQRFCSTSGVAGDAASEQDEGQAEAGETTTESPAETSAAAVAEEEVVETRLPMPAAWRDAGQWVDLEFERAGLFEGGDEHGTLQSDWGSEKFPHPDSGVLFPHAAINDHRRRPFVLPRGAMRTSAKGGLNQEKALMQLEANRERLETFWRSSSSHGISWDDLDEAYVRFAKTGTKRYDDWARKDSDGNIKALKMKEQAMQRAREHLRRFIPDGADPFEKHPSQCKRLASRYFKEEKRKWLSPWRPGRLTVHLQQLVVARMLRRETEERAFGLREPALAEERNSAAAEPAPARAAAPTRRTRPSRK